VHTPKRLLDFDYSTGDDAFGHFHRDMVDLWFALVKGWRWPPDDLAPSAPKQHANTTDAAR
jgi:hypothetical protein